MVRVLKSTREYKPKTGLKLYKSNLIYNNTADEEQLILKYKATVAKQRKLIEMHKSLISGLCMSIKACEAMIAGYEAKLNTNTNQV